MYYFEPVMIVCMVESEMGWLVIPEREKKLLLSCYKLNFTYIYMYLIHVLLNFFIFYLLFMFQLIYIFLLQLIFNCFPLFFVMGMFANEFEMVPSVQCNQLIKQQLL